MSITVNKICTYEKLLPKMKKKKLLPLTAVPLVAYTAYERERDRLKRIAEEKDHLAKVVTERTKYNTKALDDMGVPKREIKNYLKADGSVTEDGKKIFRQHNKTFKGSPDESSTAQDIDYTNEEHFSVEMENFKQHLPCSTELSPELDNVYHSPDLGSARGLMKSILGEDLMAKFEADLDSFWDSMAHIKEMTLEVLGLGG